MQPFTGFHLCQHVQTALEGTRLVCRGKGCFPCALGTSTFNHLHLCHTRWKAFPKSQGGERQHFRMLARSDRVLWRIRVGLRFRLTVVGLHSHSAHTCRRGLGPVLSKSKSIGCSS
jgi:hypothetical protein